MTREEARKAAEVMLAYADGKGIEFKTNGTGKWLEANEPSFDWQNNADRFRVKPEPKYRPFNSAEECWQEMQKHQPFGWIQDKDCKDFKLYVLSVDDGGIMIADYANDIIRRTYEAVFFDSAFADGTPFGMLEESV